VLSGAMGQLHSTCTQPQPRLASGDVVDVKLRALLPDEGFEQGQNILDVSLALLHVLGFDLFGRRDRALVLPRRDGLELDPLLVAVQAEFDKHILLKPVPHFIDTS
jgi:hypothetical protein